MFNQKKNSSLELKAWIIIFAIALILTGIGLILFMLSGNGSFSDFFQDISSVNFWLLIIIIAVIAAGIIILLNSSEPSDRSKWSVNELVVAALCIALSFVLSYIKIYELPNGGSITPASMLPIFLFAYYPIRNNIKTL